MKAIVCADPQGTLPIGFVIDGIGNITAAKNRGVALLPFNDQLPPNALVGYVQRHFGLGWLFDRNVGERGCPMAIHVTTACRYLSWAACVGPAEPGPWSATLRLVHSADNQRGISRGMNQISYPELGHRSDGDLVVHGQNGFTTTGEGLLYCDLYVRASNTRVKWLAITEHEHEAVLW